MSEGKPIPEHGQRIGRLETEYVDACRQMEAARIRVSDARLAIRGAQRERIIELEAQLAELEDHYRGAREIIQGERLRRIEAERVSLNVQTRLAELAGQVKQLREAAQAVLDAGTVDTEFILADELQALRDVLRETEPDGE